jgi:hypothetical protein
MKNTFILVLMLILQTSCSRPKLTIIKQWHLSSNTTTTDIEQATHLPQFENQKEIYQYLKEKITKNNKQSLVVEGCEGEITQDFLLNFNGWDLQKLKAETHLPQYDKIMTQIGIKLKAKFPDARILCGDSLDLIQKNGLAFSELRGHLGFLTKMINAKNLNQEEVFKKYSDEYLKLYPGESANVISDAKFNTEKYLKMVEDLIALRNDVFVKKAIEELNNQREVVIVIGALHFKDLKEKLKKNKLAFFEYIPQSYDQNEDDLLSRFKTLIKGIGEKALVFFQVPENFSIDKFPIKKTLNWNEISTEEEKLKLQTLVSKAKIPEQIILSDYDADGIRDFTLSENPSMMIISAEDHDWDNDGIDNLNDESIEKIQFPLPQLKKMENIFNVELDKNIENEIKNFFEKKKINLINREGQSHDLYILYWLKKLLEYYQLDFQLKNINATKPLIRYGKDVYFSYVPQSKSLEIYIENFKYYIKDKQTEFNGVTIDKFIKGFITPVIVHSLLHELYHALQGQNENSQGWTFQEEEIKSQYLTQKRLPQMAIDKQLTHLKYLGKSHEEWKQEIKKFEDLRSQLVKKFPDPHRFKKEAAKSIYFTQTKNLDREFQLSLLNKYKIPSYYSFTKPSEFHAEVFAACEIHKFIKNIDTLEEGIRMEILIGFNTMKRCP